MAAIYRSEHYGTTVGITDLSRCTDSDCIDNMTRYLLDDMKCDLIILSNTCYEEIRDHTNILNVGHVSWSSTSFPVNRRCIPFKKKRMGEYIFEDMLIQKRDRQHQSIDKVEIWEELRQRPFQLGERMEDNLGWAPGMLTNRHNGDWQRTHSFGFYDI